ncbi:fimbria/pilus outer membrane usher protein [Escherichia albertii]
MDAVNIRRLLLFIIFFNTSSVIAVEFNLNVLDKSMRNSVDYSLLKDPAAIAPGDYFVAITVNNNKISAGKTIRWQQTGDTTQPCIPTELANSLGLTEDVRHSLKDVKGCVDFSSRPDIIFLFDQVNQQLNITIPQAWLLWHSQNWTPPETWDAGIPGFILDYNLFASAYRPTEGDKSNNINTYGTAGLNVQSWRLRSDYQYEQTQTDNQHKSTDSIARTYLFRPLPTLGARLTLGESDLSSSIFDGFSYTGAELSSDDRMLPWELRGYAPQINGMAQTHATVTVSYAGRVIYQTKVAPGPFIITDLNQSVQGTLDVKVTEEDGRVNSFQVSAASTPFLTRQGQLRYSIATGRARPSLSHHVADETFLSSEGSWGMLSNTSLYGGILLSGENYRSVALGIGQNMLWLGAISFDITRANSQFTGNTEETGSSYRVNYSKRFDATDSVMSLSAYRFSDRHFHSYANFIDHQYNNADTDDEKQTISLTASQPISLLNMNLSMSVLRQSWWNDDSTTTANISAGFNFDVGRWKDISLTTAYNTTHYQDSGNDNQIYISISLPIGESTRLSYDMQNSETTSHRVSWNDYSDSHNTWGIASGVESNKPDYGAQFSANYTHTASAGEWDLSGNYAVDDYRSLSTSWSGSFTATPQGAAFHRRATANEPRLMVSTNGIAGIPIDGNDDYTNTFGYAVVPMISSYQPTTIAVNMDDLPDGVTVSENTVRETWTEGAIGYKSLASRAGKEINVIIRDQAGNTPPLGAVIRHKDNQTEVGMVSEEGHAWISGINAGQQLIVLWGNNMCQITLPEVLENISQRLLLPCH